MTDQGSPSVMQHIVSVEFSSLLLHIIEACLCFYRDDSLALCNLWSGVMEWSLGVEPWSGVLEWILEWNEVRF